MTDFRVVDNDADTVVYTTTLGAEDRVPPTGAHIWVPENGETAYRVLGVEHDFEADVITAICKPMPKDRFYQ